MWVDIGNAGFSPGKAFFTCLAFNTSGEPYMAFEDYGNAHKLTVMKFDGMNWVIVGTAGFSAGWAEYISIGISPSGQPYVAYTNYVSYNRGAAVNKFDGTNWVYVGQADFSNGSATYTTLAFNPSDGHPYVGYADYGNTHKATVMYFNAPNGLHELKNSQILVSPNPLIDKITIEKPGKSQSSNLLIVNIDGKKVMSCQITEAKTTINVGALPCGIYFIRLSDELVVQTGKFVKQ